MCAWNFIKVSIRCRWVFCVSSCAGLCGGVFALNFHTEKVFVCLHGAHG